MPGTARLMLEACWGVLEEFGDRAGAVRGAEAAEQLAAGNLPVTRRSRGLPDDGGM